MASIQARDVTTAPVTAPADAKTEEQVPEKVPETVRERRPHSAGEKDMFVDIDGEKTPVDEEESEILDNRFPFPPLKGAPEEEQQLTVRALVVGICLGAVVSASNIYLGLKTGWTFGASLFGGILGFAILKSISRIAPRILGGGYFGPKVCDSHENIILPELTNPGVGKCYCSDRCHRRWWSRYYLRWTHPGHVPDGSHVEQG